MEDRRNKGRGYDNRSCHTQERRQGAGTGLAERREECGVKRLVATIDYCSNNTDGLEKKRA